RQERRVLTGAASDLAASHEDCLALRHDLRLERAVDGVVLEQVSQRLGVREIVDSDDFDILRLQGRPEEHATDSTESVDTDANAHGRAPCGDLGSPNSIKLYGRVDDAGNC